MKHSLSIAAMAISAVEVAAFPSRMFGMAGNQDQRRAISEAAAAIDSAATKRAGTPLAPGFSASQQYVSNNGDYAFVAPGPNDIRGPCPGLNAMANHNYIPHNGVATIPQFIQGTYDVFGMGTDLATFLAVYGAVFDGDLTSWSIGGPPPAGLLQSIGLISQPTGLTGSHNKYEGDASPTRPDLYEYGNNYKVVMSQFEQLYAQPLGPNGYDLSTLTKFRSIRFNQSIANNPNFFNAPFSGLLVQPAAYTFIYRFMGNKSAEYPQGYLDSDVLKSFFSITGEAGSFVYTEGNEKIPDNWYKRAIGDEYTIPYFLLDVVAAAAEYPEFLNVGGNTGTTNTFTGVDLTDLTGGVYNGATLLQGDNLGCFALQSTQNAAPDILGGLFSDASKAINTLNNALDGVLTTLTCPQLESIDMSLLEGFPGSSGVD